MTAWRASGRGSPARLVQRTVTGGVHLFGALRPAARSRTRAGSRTSGLGRFAGWLVDAFAGTARRRTLAA